MSAASRRLASSAPTLAEQIETERGVEPSPVGHGVLVVVDGPGASDVSRALPDETVAPPPGSLGELRALVAAHDLDVLLLDDLAVPTKKLVDALASGLAADSASATVSFDPAVRWKDGRLPPPSTAKPRAGTVLVRRDHLVLALDEAALLADRDVRLIGVPSGRGVAADALASLVRPGFVHRACAGPPPPGEPAPVAPRGSAGPFDAEVVLDGRALAFPLSGSQAQLIGLLGGLVRAGTRVAVLAPDALHDTTAAGLGELREAVPFLDRGRVGRPSIFHRPFQIGSLDGLEDCLAVGERLVVTLQDTIAERTPAYAPGAGSWQRFRMAAAAVRSSADELTFYSRHAALDAASDGGLDLGRATVIPLGLDHIRDLEPPDAPAAPLGRRPFLLVLGNAYWHKNRSFALRLTRWLVERHGWEGGLVLAGGHPGHGSSQSAEEALVRDAPGLEGRVADLGYVSDAKRLALYAGAELVLYPTLQEGFGFVPFEAAALGKACVYAHRASMRELLPAAGALPSFDLDEAGAFVLHVLQSGVERRRIAAAVDAAAAGLTWDCCAAGYREVYARALERPPRAGGRTRVAARRRTGVGASLGRVAELVRVRARGGASAQRAGRSDRGEGRGEERSR